MVTTRGQNKDLLNWISGWERSYIVIRLNRSQTTEIYKSWAKYFKAKVVIFTVLSLIYYQYTVNLPNVLKV